MAFPRAPLKRFNDVQDKTPGVGAYNLYRENAGKDKTGSVARINETVRNCRDKALMAAEKGTLPKHIEEIHSRLAKAEERVVDLEILKISWDKQRELTEKEKGELRQKLIKLENVQEKHDKAECFKLELEEQIKSHLKEIERLEHRVHELEMKDMEVEKIKANLEKEKSKLKTELEKLKKMFSESQNVTGKQKDDIVCLKKNASDAQNEILSLKEEFELLKVTKEKESHEFENEKRILTTQVESLSSKCSEWEDKYMKTHKASAKEIGALLEANVQKVCEIEEKKRVLENLEMKCQKDLEQMKEQEEQLKGRMLQLEENEHRLQKKSAELSKDLSICEEEKRRLENECELLKVIKENTSQEFENEKRILTTQVEFFNSKCTEWEDKYTKTCEANAEKIEALLKENVQKVSEIEEKNRVMENLEVHYGKRLEQMQEQEEQLKGRMLHLEENELRLEKESVELSRNLSICEEEKRRLENECEVLKVNKENTSQDFENEKRILTTQVELLNTKCTEWEDKYTKICETSAEKIEALLEENVQKVSEIEEKNRVMENLEVQYGKHLDQMKEQEEQLKGRILHLEENELRLEKESAELSRNLSICEEEKRRLENECELLKVNKEDTSQEFENEKRVLTTQVELLNAKCTEWENKYAKTCEANAKEIEALLEENVQKASEIEEKNRVMENREMQYGKDLEQMQEQEEQLKRRMLHLEENELRLQKESAELSNKLSTCEEEKRWLEDEIVCLERSVCITHSELKFLKEECESLNVTVKNITQEFENEKTILTTQLESLHNKCAELEDKYTKACESSTQKITALLEENVLRTCEIEERNRMLENLEIKCCKDLELMKEQEEQLKGKMLELEENELRLREESDQEIEGLNTIISEMSEKIEQFECERAELLTELDEDWKEKYEDLVKRMEPFKEVLDGFELERQLLQDRDKFTSEQLEKLTQECIKNMGHQNHKQRIKYLDKIKQENLNLFKTVHELQELNRRQEATIKKLKEKTMDKTETSKKLWQKTPLKEGNRL